MSVSEMPVTTAVDAAIYAELQHFYARQMHLLDDGDVDRWADTFTEDGVFGTAAVPEPAVGREAIRHGARAVADELASAGVTRRHWIGMIAAEPVDGGLRVRSYALTYQTPGDGTAELRHLNVCVDHLVRDGGSWIVRDRRIGR